MDDVHGAPRLKHRETVIENQKLRVFKDHLVWGDHEVPDYIVVAPVGAREDLIGGVAVVPVCGDEVVLVRMFRHATRRSGLEVPRGFVEPGEDPREAASRELAEEAALDCPPDRLVSLGYCTPEPGIVAARIALFLAPDCQPCLRRPDVEPGLGATVRVKRDALPALLTTAELEDSTSGLALLRWLMIPRSL